MPCVCRHAIIDNLCFVGKLGHEVTTINSLLTPAHTCFPYSVYVTIISSLCYTYPKARLNLSNRQTATQPISRFILFIICCLLLGLSACSNTKPSTDLLTKQQLDELYHDMKIVGNRLLINPYKPFLRIETGMHTAPLLAYRLTPRSVISSPPLMTKQQGCGI